MVKLPKQWKDWLYQQESEMSQSNNANANANLIAAVLDLHAELENVLAAYEDLRIKTFIEKDVAVADTRIINAKINAKIAMAKARGER